MPVEIKELVIRAVAQGGSAPPTAGAKPTAAHGACSGGGAAGKEDDIVELAVRQVLRILRATRER